MPENKTLIELQVPSGDAVPVCRRRFGGGKGPRVALVAGIRGDTPEGIRVAHDLGVFLEEHEGSLQGTVDIYPCVNPLAAHRGSRLWPFFDIDLNRRFPGRPDGHPPDCTAHALVSDIRGADQVIELRGAHPAFREASQAHVRHRDVKAADLANGANVVAVWRRGAGPAASATFAHQFPGTIVLEGGSGNRLTPGVGKDLCEGVLSMLSTLDVIPEAVLPFHWAGLGRPVVVTDDQVVRIRANHGGLFLPSHELWETMTQGEELGVVVEPATGAVLETIRSPADGRLLAIREHPVVFPGSMVGRMVLGDP